MKSAAIVVAVIAVAISGFSAGYGLAMYLTGSFYIRMQVEKRLKNALDRRCARCHERSAATDSASETIDTMSDATDR